MFSKWTCHQELVYIIWLTHSSVQLFIYCAKIPGEKHNWGDYFVCWSSNHILTTTVYVQQGIFYTMMSFLNIRLHSGCGLGKHNPGRWLNLNSKDHSFLTSTYDWQLCFFLFFFRLESKGQSHTWETRAAICAGLKWGVRRRTQVF